MTQGFAGQRTGFSAGLAAVGDPDQQISPEPFALRLEPRCRSGALNPARDAIWQDHECEQAKGDVPHPRILVPPFYHWKGTYWPKRPAICAAARASESSNSWMRRRYRIPAEWRESQRRYSGSTLRSCSRV